LPGVSFRFIKDLAQELGVGEARVGVLQGCAHSKLLTALTKHFAEVAPRALDVPPFSFGRPLDFEVMVARWRDLTDWLSLADASQALGVSTSSIRQLVSRGLLSANVNRSHVSLPTVLRRARAGGIQVDEEALQSRAVRRSRYDPDHVYKVCPQCGARYTREQYLKIPLDSVMHFPEHVRCLEHRTCHCHDTFSDEIDCNGFRRKDAPPESPRIVDYEGRRWYTLPAVARWLDVSTATARRYARKRRLVTRRFPGLRRVYVSARSAKDGTWVPSWDK
jgi:hypothetical protein